MTLDDLGAVSPALRQYTAGPLLAELWARPQLAARDRSIVTVAALIARSQTSELEHHLDLALENGVEPAELSEIITHLAFYAGWAAAVLATSLARPIFQRRGIGADQLPPAGGGRLPLDEAAEAQRAAAVDQAVGRVFQGLVDFTGRLLFHDLWLRPALAPRDRSLVTVSALVATGQVAQIAFHLGKAMDSGLTQEQAAEAVTHLAFYAGWPSAMSAVPVAKAVFEKRSA